MSAPRKYEPAFGVCNLTWELGEPTNEYYFGPVLCEVWKARTEIAYSPANKPAVIVNAYVEIRYKVSGQWWRAQSRGGLEEVPDTSGAVRRHCVLNRQRTWRETIVLDGWGE